mgnify:FL=1
MSVSCYYGDKISTNIAKTPEGFLICKNVPIARTGYQTYLESELIEDGDPSERVNVYRSPDEVFSPATLASFEGKPVCNGHPCVDVTPDNYKVYSKGHVQHVRIGKGDDADKILADLYITDKDLIDEIQNGKREVSAGYYAEDKEDSTGRICQTKIRGNHVAVVDEGRAGRSVCIRDAAKDINSSINNPSGGLSMKMDRKRKVANLVARYLRDAEPDQLEERLKDAAEVLNEELAKEDEDVIEEKEEMKDACKDEDPKDMELWKKIDEIMARLDAIEERFHDEDPKEDEAPEDAPLADEDELEEEAEVISDEDEDEDLDIDIDEDEDEDDDVDVIPTDEVEAKLSAKDAAIKDLSKAALSIKNPADRKRMQDAIIKMTSNGKSQMSGLMNTVRKNQKSKKDSSTNKVYDVEKLQAIYDKLNPHKGK